MQTHNLKRIVILFFVVLALGALSGCAKNREALRERVERKCYWRCEEAVENNPAWYDGNVNACVVDCIKHTNF